MTPLSYFDTPRVVNLRAAVIVLARGFGERGERIEGRNGGGGCLNFGNFG